MLQPTPLFSRCSLSLAGLNFRSGSTHATIAANPRSLLQWVSDLGLRAVTLDGTMPTIRARELDRSGRRDLASALRRLDLSFGGIDLCIPPAHITSPAHQDRAFAAIREALDLAAELSALCGPASTPLVSILTPPQLDPPVLTAIAQLLDATHASLALITWPAPVFPLSTPRLGLSMDPARILAAGLDPAKELARLKPAPLSLRLNDFDGVSRCPLGKGNLNFLSFTVAASIAAPDLRCVLDCAGLPDCEAALVAASRI